MKKLIVANWKMNPKTAAEARSIISPIEHRMHQAADKLEVVVCPPYPFLPLLSHYTHFLKLGAQDISWEDSGAFTGEISALQLRQWNVNFVILGHSERRVYLGETDTMVNQKIKTSLRHRITPIVCLGGGKGIKKTDMRKIITKQFQAVTGGIDKKHLERIIFVYEPVWAISTMKKSQPATGKHASELILHIQNLLAHKLGVVKAKNMRILYGGTVNKHNVHEFAKYLEIDGALVGAASLEPENFWEVIKEFHRESIHRG